MRGFGGRWYEVAEGVAGLEAELMMDDCVSVRICAQTLVKFPLHLQLHP